MRYIPIMTVFLLLSSVLIAQEVEELDVITVDQPSTRAEMPNLVKEYTSTQEEPARLIEMNFDTDETESDSSLFDEIGKDPENAPGDINFFNFLKIFSAQLLKPSTVDNESDEVGDDSDEEDGDDEDEDEEKERDEEPGADSNIDYMHVPTTQEFLSYRNSSTSRS